MRTLLLVGAATAVMLDAAPVLGQARTWVRGGNAQYTVTMNDVSWRDLAGMFAMLTATDHPLTHEWGRAVDLILLQRECWTCDQGDQDRTIAVVRSHASRRAYVLGRNPHFILEPEPGWDCVNASEVALPRVVVLDDPSPGCGVSGTWVLDDAGNPLIIDVRLIVHGSDWIDSRIELSLSVTNDSTVATAVSARTAWATVYTGTPRSGTWGGDVKPAFIGVRPPDPPLEPFAIVESEWTNPAFRMWQAHGGTAEPSRSSPYYSVAGLIRPIAGVMPPATPPELFQITEMNPLPHLSPVPGGGVADSCFEWRVGPAPRALRHLFSPAITTTWGLTDETATPLPPGATATFTQYLVAFRTYPVSADAGGPYEAECAGGVARAVLTGRAVLAAPTAATVHHEWSSDAPGVTFDDPQSPTPTVTAPGAGMFPLQLTVTAGAYQASARTTLEVRDVEPPRFRELRVTPEALWPPSHRLVPVTVMASIDDDCDAAPRLRLVAVTSSEAADGRGDGATRGDIAGAELGTDDREVLLRAERSGTGRGREYVLTYEAEDASGNVAARSVTVRVAHDARGNATRRLR